MELQGRPRLVSDLHAPDRSSHSSSTHGTEPFCDEMFWLWPEFLPPRLCNSPFANTATKMCSSPGGEARAAVGRVRLIFKVPVNQLETIFSGCERTPSHLAYIEWFTPFGQPGASHGLHRVSYAMSNPGNEHITSVVELDDIQAQLSSLARLRHHCPPSLVK